MRHSFFKVRSNINRKREAGFSLVEIISVIVIIGIVLAYLVPRLGDATRTARVNLAHQEVIGLISATTQYRHNEGSYTGLTTAKLVADGYHIEENNVYGKGITIVAVSAIQATITYTLTEAKACKQLAVRLKNSIEPSTAVCSAMIVTVTIN